MGKKVLTAYERALEEGEFKNKLDTARKMREFGDTLDKITFITGLSEVELRENGIV